MAERRSRAFRLLLPFLLVGVLLAGCTAPPWASLTASTTKHSNALALVNLWRVDKGEGVDDATWLRLDGTDLMAWNRCGHGEGDWDAAQGQLLATFYGEENHLCTRGKPMVLPWLAKSSGYRIYSATHAALLDAAGEVVANLIVKGHPPQSAYYADTLRYAPSQVSARREFVAPVGLPSEAKAPADLTGRWIPAKDTAHRAISSLEFFADGSWKSVERCGGTQTGHWTLAADGRLLRTMGMNWLVACGRMPGNSDPEPAVLPSLETTARVGMVGNQLAFFDAKGTELGRAVRG